MRRGLLLGLAAYVSWGFFPIYFKSLRPSGALEILAHRIVWSAVFVALLLFALRRWPAVLRLVRDRRTLGGIGLAAALIGVNWFTYIHGVNNGHVVETSLGYFITPLITVLLGVLLLGERLRPYQWTAVGLGALAVAVLTIDYGRLPYLALVLAATFGCYGLIKKRLGVPPAEGLLVESAALAVPALAVLAWFGARAQATVGHVSAGHTALVLLGGVITATPLLLFAAATNRIPLTSMGILQYVAPVLQLSVGLFVYHEPMPPARLAGFTLVWLALALFTWDAVHQRTRTAAALRKLVDEQDALRTP